MKRWLMWTFVLILLFSNVSAADIQILNIDMKEEIIFKDEAQLELEMG